jgi:hypothetical protein
LQFRGPVNEGAGEIAVYGHDVQDSSDKMAASISRSREEYLKPGMCGSQ